MYQELAIQTLLINLINTKTLEIITGYMIQNLLFIIKPFISSYSWNRRNLGSTNYFKQSEKLLYNLIIDIFYIFTFNLKLKYYEEPLPIFNIC